MLFSEGILVSMEIKFFKSSKWGRVKSEFFQVKCISWEDTNWDNFINRLKSLEELVSGSVWTLIINYDIDPLKAKILIDKFIQKWLDNKTTLYRDKLFSYKRQLEIITEMLYKNIINYDDRLFEFSNHESSNWIDFFMTLLYLESIWLIHIHKIFQEIDNEYYHEFSDIPEIFAIWIPDYKKLIPFFTNQELPDLAQKKKFAPYFFDGVNLIWNGVVHLSIDELYLINNFIDDLNYFEYAISIDLLISEIYNDDFSEIKFYSLIKRINRKAKSIWFDHLFKRKSGNIILNLNFKKDPF